MTIHRLALVLILIANICLLHQPVNGDKDAMVAKVCGWTSWPDVCRPCLSTPHHDFWDEDDLAGESIKCASRLSFTVIDDFAGLGNSTGDDAVKALCAGCQGIINDVVNSMVLAFDDSVAGKYTDGGDKVEVAVARFYDCVQLFFYVNPPVTLPHPFSDHFSTLIKHYINTKAILYKLSDVLRTRA